MKRLILLAICLAVVSPAFAGIPLSAPPSPLYVTNRSAAQLKSALGPIDANSITGSFPSTVHIPITAWSPTNGITEVAGNDQYWAMTQWGGGVVQPSTNDCYITDVAFGVSGTENVVGAETGAHFWIFQTPSYAASGGPGGLTNVLTATCLYSNFVLVPKLTYDNVLSTIQHFSVPNIHKTNGGFMWAMLMSTNAGLLQFNRWRNDTVNTNGSRPYSVPYIASSGAVTAGEPNYNCASGGYLLSGWTNQIINSLSGYIAQLATVESGVSKATDLAYSRTTSTLPATNAQQAVDSISAQLDFPMRVVVAGTNIWVRTPWNTGTNLVQGMSLNDTDDPVVFTAIYFAGNTLADSAIDPSTMIQIKQAGDDVAPLYTGAANLGGTHLPQVGTAITRTNHGKLTVDIGSVWKDSNNTNFTLIAIPDTNTLWFMSDDAVTNTYAFTRTAAGSSLTHVSGATETTAITIDSQAVALIGPTLQRQTKTVLLNGVTTITNAGIYAGRTLDVVHGYDVVDLDQIPSFFRSKVGSTNATALNDPAMPPVIHVTDTYHFAENGSCTVFTELQFYKPCPLNYAGFVQSMAIIKPTGGRIYELIPGTVQFVTNGVTYNLTNLFDLTDNTNTVELTSAYWADTNNPPSRSLQIATDASTNRIFGHYIGFNQAVGQGKPSLRTNAMSGSAYSMRPTLKQYPYAVSFSSPQAQAPGTVYDVVAFRCPVNCQQFPSLSAVAWYEIGDDAYLNLDFGPAFTGYIALPQRFVGRRVELVDGVSPCPSGVQFVSQDGLFVSATNQTAVLRLTAAVASAAQASPATGSGSITVGTNNVQLATGITNLTITAGANATVSGTSTAGSAIITITGTPPGAGIDEATATTIANTAAQNATNGLTSALLQAKVGAGVYDASGAALGATNGLTSALLQAKIGSSVYDANGAATTAAQNATNGMTSALLQSKIGASVYDAYGAAGNATNPLGSAAFVATSTFDAAGVGVTAAQNATNGMTSALLQAKIGAGVYDASGAATTAAQNATNGMTSALLTAKIGAGVYDVSGAALNATNGLNAVAFTGVAPLVAPGITITNDGVFLSAVSNIYLGTVWNVSTYPQYYLGTNANFSLSVAGLAGTGTNWQLGTLYITNRAGSASPIVVTLSGAWSTCLSVTGGMANAFAVTNDAYLTVNHLGATNVWATTR